MRHQRYNKKPAKPAFNQRPCQLSRIGRHTFPIQFPLMPFPGTQQPLVTTSSLEIQPTGNCGCRCPFPGIVTNIKCSALQLPISIYFSSRSNLRVEIHFQSYDIIHSRGNRTSGSRVATGCATRCMVVQLIPINAHAT